MTQLNLHVTPDFEKDLRQLMKVKHIPTKAEAIRLAVKESLKYSIHQVKPMDFSNWVGLAKQVPVNKKPYFQSDDDLWK